MLPYPISIEHNCIKLHQKTPVPSEHTTFDVLRPGRLSSDPKRIGRAQLHAHTELPCARDKARAEARASNRPLWLHRAPTILVIDSTQPMVLS
eukprot:2588044-Prymnesium_polylepis.1